MKQREGRPFRRLALLLLAMGASPGCAPTLDVAGVYFPGWLVSALAGVVAAYLVVLWLGRRPKTRGVADSGLLFVSLVVGIGLSVWWIAFSGF